MTLYLSKKYIKPKKRYLHYLVIKNKESILFQKRSQGIWKGLYEFPFIELTEEKLNNHVLDLINNHEIFKSKKILVTEVSKEYIHLLTPKDIC